MANTAQFSDADFSSRIAKKGLASPNKFEVFFIVLTNIDPSSQRNHYN